MPFYVICFIFSHLSKIFILKIWKYLCGDKVNIQRVKTFNMCVWYLITVYFSYFQHVRATWSRFHVALGSVVGLLVVTICKSLMFSVLLRVFFSQSDPERFGSLLNTTATVFQLLTLDNWMNIYYTSRDNGTVQKPTLSCLTLKYFLKVYKVWMCVWQVHLILASSLFCSSSSRV